MASTLRVGHIGAVIRRTILSNITGSALDVSTATAKTLKIERPDGTVLSKTASFTTDGTDGQLEYSTISGDLDQPGEWRGQFYLEFGATQAFHTDQFPLPIGSNLGG